MKMTSHNTEDHTMNRAAWFALGLLSGAALAFLTTPATGRDNRQMLRRRARQVADAAGTVVDEGGSFVDSQKRRMAEVVDQGRTEAQAFGSRLTDAFEHGKSAYRNAKEHFHAGAETAGEGIRQAADDVVGPRANS